MTDWIDSQVELVLQRLGVRTIEEGHAKLDEIEKMTRTEDGASNSQKLS